MALAELVRTLELEAEEQAASVLDAARAEAERLLNEKRAEIARRRQAALESREAELRAAAARDLELARREAARVELEARAAALARIRARAEELLEKALADPETQPRLIRDADRALDYVGAVAAVVECPAPLASALRDHVGARARVVAAADGRSGVVVHAADGSVTVDATPASRLARAWPRLAIELAARMEARP